MADPAFEETEKILKKIESRLQKEYKQATKEVNAKLDDYLKRFAIKDDTWSKWVNDVKDSDPKEYNKRLKEYKEWRTGQMAIGKRWQEMKDTLAEDYHNANEIAKSITQGYMPEVYALNHNYGTFEVEKSSQLDTSYTLYDRQTVERLIRDDPSILPPPGKRVSKEIAAGKDILWNKQQIQSVMIQGILQGKSIPDIATSLAKTVGDKNHKAAIRNARTMTTAAQNAGRVDSYKRAENMGIPTEKQWLATLDSRTRHSHRHIDGEIVLLNDEFSNGCKFPGDPECRDPGEIYNCRCTLLSVIKGHKIDTSNTELRHNSKLGDMSYDEWKNSKEKPDSNPITLPEEKGEAIKNAYIAEYRRKAGQIGGGGTAKTKSEQPVKTPAEKTTETLANAYEYHRTKNNLHVVPYDEIKDLNIISANYGKLSQETALAFDKTITKLSREYDTTLQKIRTMTKEEALGNNAFASVVHDYSVDNSLMVINPVKCKDSEKLASRINELSKNGYAVKIQAGKEMEYVPTHEFAHTLINMEDKLSDKTNWVNADYAKIRSARKEIKEVYQQYIDELKPIEEKARELELDFLISLDDEKGEKARELALMADKIRLSEYSLNNADEFMAEAFTHAKIGEGENKYSAKVLEIIDKYFKR